jgi:hypothetical protein
MMKVDEEKLCNVRQQKDCEKDSEVMKKPSCDGD